LRGNRPHVAAERPRRVDRRGIESLCETLGVRDMKLLTALALIVGANAGLLLWGEAPLIWSTSTSDQWNRSCHYYYPVRTFEVVAPLSQNCPRWTNPR
jgi:hypothetical protein